MTGGVVFERVAEGEPADFSLDALLAPIEEADDDAMRVIKLAARVHEEPDFIFEVIDPPQRTRIFRCRYGTVLRVVR
jgi:hypothetical protein